MEQQIVIPCVQRLHQFYQPEPEGVAQGRELIKTGALQCSLRMHGTTDLQLLDCKLVENVSMEGLQ